MRYRAVFCTSFLATAFWVFHSASGEPSAPTNTSSTATNAADDFDALVKRGDQARRKGDVIAAIKAYRDAIKLKDDTLVEGRLGLLLFEAQAFDLAAQHLQHAIEKPSNTASGAEYASFSTAYRVAQKASCRLNVVIDHLGARFEVDGDVVQEGQGEFWFFVTPGKHTVRVSLDGFEDEIQEIDALKGEHMPLKFTMRAIAKLAPEPEKKALFESTSTHREASSSTKTNEPFIVPEDKPTAKTNSKSKGQFVVGAGVALMLGTTPKPALGPQFFGAWRSRSWWEIGLDGRVGGMVSEDKRFPNTQFVTWSAGVTPCARLRDRFFACALVQIEGVGINDDSRTSVLPGIGLRGGFDIPVHPRVRIQIFAEGTGHLGRFEFQPNWVGSAFTGSIGTRGTFAF